MPLTYSKFWVTTISGRDSGHKTSTILSYCLFHPFAYFIKILFWNAINEWKSAVISIPFN